MTCLATVAGLLLLIPFPSFAADFPNVTYHRCYDGETCTFTIPSVHPLFGEKISVRIAGIDTPEIRGKCQEETALAMQARNLVRRMLGQARRIDLLDAERGKYFRIVARVLADGRDIGQTLIDRGMAVAYDGGKKTKDWCADDLSPSSTSSRSDSDFLERQRWTNITSGSVTGGRSN